MVGVLKDRDEDLKMCPEEKRQFRIECNGCGQCCRAFPLPWNEDQVRANAAAAMRGDSRYTYKDNWGDYREGYVNAMMAMWAADLEAIEIPEEYKEENLEEGVSVSMNWYCCNRYLDTGKGGICTVHQDRPKVCRDFQPRFQGGYLDDPKAIVYKECSYRLKWPEGELPEDESTLSAVKRVKD